VVRLTPINSFRKLLILGKVIGVDVNGNNQLSAAIDSGLSVVNRKVPPKRVPDTRPRKHLTPSEVDALILAARKSGRHHTRDELAVLLSYRHGLRAAELVGLEWAQIDLQGATLVVRRAKGGYPTVHPLREVELRLLGRMRKEAPQNAYVLTSERGTPWTTSNWRKILQRLADAAGDAVAISVNPHALRHACGFYLASKGIDTRALSHYLGHRSLQSTERYTAQSANRFKDFWRE
jgi:integrase